MGAHAGSEAGRRHPTVDLPASQAEALFGYSSDELHGQPIGLLVPERYRERHTTQRAQ